MIKYRFYYVNAFKKKNRNVVCLTEGRYQYLTGMRIKDTRLINYSQFSTLLIIWTASIKYRCTVMLHAHKNPFSHMTHFAVWHTHDVQ